MIHRLSSNNHASSSEVFPHIFVTHHRLLSVEEILFDAVLYLDLEIGVCRQLLQSSRIHSEEGEILHALVYSLDNVKSVLGGNVVHGIVCLCGPLDHVLVEGYDDDCSPPLHPSSDLQP
jgi:hypothetical protein